MLIEGRFLADPSENCMAVLVDCGPCCGCLDSKSPASWGSVLRPVILESSQI